MAKNRLLSEFQQKYDENEEGKQIHWNFKQEHAHLITSFFGIFPNTEKKTLQRKDKLVKKKKEKTLSG